MQHFGTYRWTLIAAATFLPRLIGTSRAPAAGLAPAVPPDAPRMSGPHRAGGDAPIDDGPAFAR